MQNIEIDDDSADLVIRTLVCGLSSGQRKGWKIVALHGYVDDSGYGDGNDPAFVLGGFIANVRRWEAFCVEWKTALDEPPAIAYLKMTEAVNLSGQFTNWKNKDRNQKLAKLYPIVERIKPMGIRSVIPCQAFRNNVKGKITKALDYPYFLALFDMLFMLTASVRHGGLDIGKPHYQTDFTFDENKKLEWMIDRWYDVVVKELPPDDAAMISKNPIFRDDKKFWPLQAADSFAWLGLQLQREKAGQRPFDRRGLDREVFKPLERIDVLEPTDGDARRFDDLADKTNAILRARGIISQ